MNPTVFFCVRTCVRVSENQSISGRISDYAVYIQAFYYQYLFCVIFACMIQLLLFSSDIKINNLFSEVVYRILFAESHSCRNTGRHMKGKRKKKTRKIVKGTEKKTDEHVDELIWRGGIVIVLSVLSPNCLVTSQHCKPMMMIDE